MKVRQSLVMFALILLTALGAACTQRASNAPLTTPTSIDFPQPVAGTPQMGIIEQLATQTELAKTSQPLAGTPAAPLIINGTPQDANPAQPTVNPLLPTTDPLIATPLPSITPLGGLPVQPTTDFNVTPLPTVPVVRPTTYTLTAGEFPYCIARRFNINPDDLLAMNGLSDGQILQPGLTLTIPQSGVFPASRALKAHPTTYTVRAGDTLASIACQFGDVDPVNIAAVNGLSASASLTVGAAIQIP